MWCSWIGRTNITKMFILPKAIYRFNTIPIERPITYFAELERVSKNLYGNTEDQRTAMISREKNKAKGITLSNIKLYYKAIVIKTARYWHKNRHTDQWNKIESQK